MVTYKRNFPNRIYFVFILSEMFVFYLLIIFLLLQWMKIYFFFSLQSRWLFPGCHGASGRVLVTDRRLLGDGSRWQSGRLPLVRTNHLNIQSDGLWWPFNIQIQVKVRRVNAGEWPSCVVVLSTTPTCLLVEVESTLSSLAKNGSEWEVNGHPP